MQTNNIRKVHLKGEFSQSKDIAVLTQTGNELGMNGTLTLFQNDYSELFISHFISRVCLHVHAQKVQTERS